MKEFLIVCLIITTALASPIGEPSVLIPVPTFYTSPYLSQYHSQDSLGQYAYGYNADVSSKAETRTIDGITRGTYSYVDALGDLQTVDYTADHLNGFRAIASNLPKQPIDIAVAPKPIEDTVEVVRARMEHLATFNKINSEHGVSSEETRKVDEAMMNVDDEESKLKHDEEMRRHEEQIRLHEEEMRRVQDEDMRKHAEELRIAEELRRDEEIRSIDEMRLREEEMRLRSENDRLRAEEHRIHDEEIKMNIERQRLDEETRKLSNVNENTEWKDDEKLRSVVLTPSNVEELKPVHTKTIVEHHPSTVLRTASLLPTPSLIAPTGYAYSYPAWYGTPYYNGYHFTTPLLTRTVPLGFHTKSVVEKPKA